MFDSGTVDGGVSSGGSGSGGSTCSQLLSASTSASVEVSVTCTHVTPASEGVSALLLSLLSPVSPVEASSPAGSEASVATGAAFSSLIGSTTVSSALDFSFSVSASLLSSSLLSSSSLSFSYQFANKLVSVRHLD